MLDSTLDDSLWWLVLDEANAPVAYAGLYTAIEGQGWLVRAGVLAHAQGRGLQTRLIRARLRAAKRLGIPRVYTYTAAYNVRSQRSLISAGLRPYRHEDGCIYYFRQVC